MTVPGADLLRVLLLVHDLDIGGAQVAVCNLATALPPLGCAPTVYAWKHGGLLTGRLRSASCPVEVPRREPNGWRRLGVPFALLQRIRRGRFHIIHAHMSDAAVWGTLLQRVSGRPCVITHHSNDLTDTTALTPSWQAWARKQGLRMSVRAAATNVVVSEAIREHLLRATGVSPMRIEVLPNCVALPPADRVRAATARRRARAARRHAADGWPRVVYVGRLAPTKGLDTLLAAWPLVVRALPAATLVLVGDGPLAAELRARAAGTGVAARVVFAGATSSVEDWLGDADLYVSASLIEGLSIALLEAMAWEIPVVVSDIPGHRELVRSGNTGRLVPVAAPGALAEAILAALAHDEESAMLAARGRQLVQQSHDLEDAARRQVAIYRQVLQGRRP